MESQLDIKLKTTFKHFLSKNDKRLEIVSDVILEQLLKILQIDANKFIDFLNTFSSNRAKGISCEYLTNNNNGDLSLSENDIKIKGFYSKTFPYLYFYKNGNEDPILKLKIGNRKSGIGVFFEYANNEFILSNYKQNLNQNNPHFISTDEFIISDDGKSYTEEKYTKIKTRPADIKVNDFDLLNEDYNFKKFYLTIMKCMYNSKINYVPLTSQSYKVISLYFYNILKNIATYENEFSFDDIIMVLDSVINNNYLPKSSEFDSINFESIPEKICSIIPYNYLEKEYAIFDVNDKHNVSKVTVSRSEKYSNIEIFNKSGKSICQYIICGTDKGFTLYRTVKDSSYSGEGVIPSFTLNLTDNELRFTPVQDKKKGNEMGSPIDIILKLNQNGSIDYFSASRSLQVCELLKIKNMN